MVFFANLLVLQQYRGLFEFIPDSLKCKCIRQGPSVGHSDNASITYIMEAKVFEEKQKVRGKTDISMAPHGIGISFHPIIYLH